LAQLTHSLTVEARRPLRRFRVILRGHDFLVDGGADGPERRGFYVVRTTLAENETAAGKLALFDFAVELRVSACLEQRFLRSGSLAVEETRALADGEEDVASGFLFYPME
jgi:hypothetical protein